MYEYEMMNVNTNERVFVWGKLPGDVNRKLIEMGHNPNEWIELTCEYID